MTFQELLGKVQLEGMPDVSKLLSAIEKAAKDAGLSVILNDGEAFIPRSRFDAEVEKKKNLDSQLKESNKTIEELKGQLKDNPELMTKITELETKVSDLNTQLKQKDEEYQATQKKESLKTYVAKHEKYKPIGGDADLVMNLMDMDAVTIAKDGTIAGADTQLELLFKQKPHVFEPIEGGTDKPGMPPRRETKKPGNESFGANLAKQQKGEADLSKARNSYFGKDS